MDVDHFVAADVLSVEGIPLLLILGWRNGWIGIQAELYMSSVFQDETQMVSFDGSASSNSVPIS